MNTAYLLTGSNQGDRLEQLARARAWIERDCGIVRDQSALYETDP
ncbi:MAG: 7,8-dihydro-6-hydroxymethylpterin-pyrophosphokinae, partial [Bacteroidota bacterium]